MSSTANMSLVLLTYNDKVLLMLRDNRVHSSDINTWCFIEVVKKNNDSFEEIILKEIQQETSLKLNSVNFLATIPYNDEEKYIYHATLTSDNLNNIKRGEGKNLDFFTLQEIEKLHLAKLTNMFLSHHNETIEKILHN